MLARPGVRPMVTLATRGVVAILFTDAVRSTERLNALGDDRVEELRRLEFGLLRDAIAAAGGSEVKSEGDGVMAVFQSPLQAVACAVAIQVSTQDRNASVPEPERLGLRVGLHAGEPVPDEEDFFGASVVVAQRLCKAAGAGQILTSELVRGLIGSRGGYRFRTLGGVV
ncbi:MAG: adenylate/guanylate cyclase domain-containing protein [Chloroflexi bacterium]|nr:adenylate/guanylate cyclase domain-containing protein [Chloroflexota bacterium]